MGKYRYAASFVYGSDDIDRRLIRRNVTHPQITAKIDVAKQPGDHRRFFLDPEQRYDMSSSGSGDLYAGE